MIALVKVESGLSDVWRNWALFLGLVLKLIVVVLMVCFGIRMGRFW